MIRALRLFCTALLALSFLSAAPPGRAAGFSIGADISGTFYDPAQSGQGFILEHIVVAGTPTVIVSWFTYLDGKPVWLVGAGAVSGDTVRVPLSIGSGADFPPRFVPSSAVLTPWGELTLRFSSNSFGQASWTTSAPGFNAGSLPLTRLTELALGGDSSLGRVAGCHSGSWFDPSQSGHGIFIEVFGPPTQRQMLAIWYAYLNGEQRWMTAIGPVSGNRATLQASITRGADFPPAFRSSDVIDEPWGTMTFTAVDADTAQWQWTSTQPGFGSGTLNLKRLSQLSGYDCGPRSTNEAARFLTQASFGPNASSISDAQTRSYADWIDSQLALPATLQRPTIETQIATQVLTDPRNGPFYKPYRVERWFNTAVNASDQLRQRMAFALSQILVVSDVGALDNNPLSVAEYNDILLRNAFGNYRTLLKEVTYSPAMAVFLTHLRNQKTDYTLDAGGQLVPGLIAPDENYAREVMQLFSIGLIERNRDFSPLLVSGNTQPTYSQDLITQTAKVLTGLGYDCTGPAVVGGLTINRNCGTATGTVRQFSTTLFFSTPGRYAIPGSVTALGHPDNYRPLVCFPRYADTGRSATSTNNYAVLPTPLDRKTLLAGTTINASSVACHSGTPAAEQQACIDYCNAQIDTLIETLFQHPNVAPFMARQLIQRFTSSNPTPAYIERVARVFEDDGSGVRGNLGAVLGALLLDPEARNPAPAESFGKLREPLLKVTALWRAFGALPGGNGAYGLFTPERAFAQRPLGANSVFNFYEPDYQQPGEIADAGLVAPEFQILDESTVITSSDQLWQLVFAGYQVQSNNTTRFAVPNNAGYLPNAALDALPTAHAALVDALDQKLLYGRMPSTMRTKLVQLLDQDLASAEHRLKVLDLVHLILISPAFAVQQ